MSMQEENDAHASVSDRTAADYAEAVDNIIGLVDMVVDALPARHPAVKTAKRVVTGAKPLARKIAKLAPVVMPAVGFVAEAAEKNVPDAARRGAQAVADKANDAGKAIGGAVGSVADRIKAVSDKKAQEKARQAARKALLDGAGIRIPAQEFMKNWKTQQSISAEGPGYLDYCGCYVIASYPQPVKKDDFTHFRGIYVGRDMHVGKNIHADLVGCGNVDVYADMKYDQHLYILLYPGTPEKLDELESSLITALDADESYNKLREA